MSDQVEHFLKTTGTKQLVSAINQRINLVDRRKIRAVDSADDLGKNELGLIPAGDGILATGDPFADNTLFTGSVPPGTILMSTIPFQEPGAHLADGTVLTRGVLDVYDQFLDYMKNTYEAGLRYGFTNGTVTIYADSSTVTAGTKLYDDDDDLYIGSDFSVEEVEGSDPVTYGVFYQGTQLSYDNTKDKQGNIAFTTAAEYQADIEQYDGCDKYVYDPVADTLKLPTLDGYIVIGTVEKIAGTVEGVTYALALAQSQAAMAHAGTPDNSRNQDITLQASGTVYVAPFDGFLFLSKTATAVGQYIKMAISNNNNYFETRYAPTATASVDLLFPVAKGTGVAVTYNTAGATNAFRFIPASSAK